MPSMSAPRHFGRGALIEEAKIIEKILRHKGSKMCGCKEKDYTHTPSLEKRKCLLVNVKRMRPSSRTLLLSGYFAL